MSSVERAIKAEDRIDCSICPHIKICEGRDYCEFAVIGPKDAFPPPSISDLSMNHIPRGLIFIRPISGCDPDSFDLPV